MGHQMMSRLEQGILLPVQLYLVTAVFALKTEEFVERLPGIGSAWTFGILGGMTLISYLTGKLLASSMQFTVNNRQVSLGTKIPPNVARVLILASLIYFIAANVYPFLAKNPVIEWLYGSIGDVYNTPIIGWIIGLIGIFMLIATLFRSLALTQAFFNGLDQMISGKAKQKPSRSNEGGYTDYEIVDDEEDEPSGPGGFLGK